MAEITIIITSSLHGVQNIGHIEKLLNLHHLRGRDMEIKTSYFIAASVPTNEKLSAPIDVPLMEPCGSFILWPSRGQGQSPLFISSLSQ